MKINLTSISYTISADGVTTTISCDFQGSEGSEYISSRLTLKEDNLTDGKTFDVLTRNEIEQLAKQRLLTLVQKSVEGK